MFGGTICSWLDTGDGVFLIDTGSSAADAKSLKAEIARTTKNKPMKWIALTHLHADSNDGLATFLPSDATIFVNAKTASLLVDFVGRLKGPAPNVIGVGERVLLVAGKLRLEIGVAGRERAHALDLYVFDAVTRTVFIGDLVTPDRCPMLSDPDSDIKGWLAALDRLDALERRRPRRHAREPGREGGARDREDAPLPLVAARVPHREEEAERAGGPRLR